MYMCCIPRFGRCSFPKKKKKKKFFVAYQVIKRKTIEKNEEIIEETCSFKCSTNFLLSMQKLLHDLLSMQKL